MTVPPVITTLNEFLTYDYAAMFPSDHPFAIFASPYVPLISVVIYLTLSRPICNILISVFGITPKGPLLQTITILHSAFLAVYSAWTCIYSVRIVWQSTREEGFWPTMCGSHESLWVSRGLGFWITHFYISKYYEFVDTWIILLKQKEPSLLQTFHHAGIVLNMWSLMVTGASPVLVVLCFNSFIHTLMYSYYVLAAMNIKSFLKPYLTSMQIAQFILGLSITLQTHFIPNCLSPAQDLSLWLMESYTIILVILFGLFFAESYLNKESSSSGGGKKPSRKVDRIASDSEFLVNGEDAGEDNKIKRQ